MGVPDHRDRDEPRDEPADERPEGPLEGPLDGELSPEERAWLAIVENYGDRPSLDDAGAEAEAESGDATSPDEETPEAETPRPASPGDPAAPFGGRFGDPRAFLVDEQGEADDARRGSDPDEEEGYVPPPPPPLPTVAPDRGLAWAGVFGSPLVLMVALVAGIDIPSWLGYALIAGFVGGFVYLVLKMPREPRDPWDDGAQV